MRCLTRNKTKFYYATLANQVELVDEYGNATGQYEVSYTHPIKVCANISAAQGEMQTRQFGESESYDKIIVLDDVNTPIDEYAILWVDTLPHLNEDGTTDTPYDYIVKKIARSLNSVSLAISKVNVR
jgi:hypothetical protein